MIKKCPYCNSIWVCWNWVNYKNIWGHECWDCTGVNETYYKVRNGIPYWILSKFHNLFKRK